MLGRAEPEVPAPAPSLEGALGSGTIGCSRRIGIRALLSAGCDDSALGACCSSWGSAGLSTVVCANAPVVPSATMAIIVKISALIGESPWGRPVTQEPSRARQVPVRLISAVALSRRGGRQRLPQRRSNSGVCGTHGAAGPCKGPGASRSLRAPSPSEFASRHAPRYLTRVSVNLDVACIRSKRPRSSAG